MKAQLLLDAKAILGEGPSWDAARNRLIWVDIYGKAVHLYDANSGVDRSIDVGQLVGAAVPAEDGTLVLAMQNGFYQLNPEDGQLTFIADPESDLPENRFNDGKCDVRGRFWAGTMRIAEDLDEAAALYCLQPDGRVDKVVEGVTCSNGIGWSPDGTTMYYIDTPTRRVDAFDYDAESGSISGRRTVITLPEERGWPDGMAVDAEGMLWVAEWGGYCVGRWNPADGSLLETVSVPASQITSCVFGGPELTDLYITSARIGESNEQLEQYPQTGGVFHVRTKVKGLPTHSFRGKG